MSKNTLELQLIIDGKQANASLTLSNENVMKIAESLRAVRRGADDVVDRFENARNVIQGFEEIVSVVRSQFGGLFTEFAQGEKAQRRIEAALRATGNASGLSAERLKEMADAFAQVSTYTDDAILSAQATLLTFDKISGDTFPRVVQSSLDVAAALGTDIAGATQLLGRALQFPDEGLTQLNRSLKIFNDQEEERIRLLVKSGQEDRARVEILDRIDAKVKGFAAADLRSPQGQIDQFVKSIDNLKESGGEIVASFVLPVVGGMTALSDAVNQLNPAVGGSIAIMGAFTVSLTALRVTGLGPAIVKTFTEMRVAVVALSTGVSGATVSLRAFAAALGPIGLAAIGIATLATVWGLVHENTQKAATVNQSYVESLRELTVAKLKIERDKIKNDLDVLEGRTQEVKKLAGGIDLILPQKDNKSATEQVLQSGLIIDKKEKLKIVEDEIQKKQNDQLTLITDQGREIKNTLDAELQQTKLKEELVKLEQQRVKLLQTASAVGVEDESGRINQLFDKRRAALIKEFQDKDKKEADTETLHLIELGEKRLQAAGENELRILEMKRAAIKSQIQDEKIKEERLAAIDAEIYSLKKQNAIRIKELDAEIENAGNELRRKNALIQLEEKYGRDRVSNANTVRLKKLKIEDEYLSNQKNNLERQLADEDGATKESVARQEELKNKIADVNLQIVQNNQEAAELVKNAWVDNLQQIGATLERSVGRMASELSKFGNSMYQLAQNNAKRDTDRERKKRSEQLKREKEDRLSHAFTQEQKDRINQEYADKQVALEEEMKKKQAAAGKKWFELQKAANIIEATVNTYTAATAALKTPPPPLGMALAALITAAGLANVAVISQQKYPGFADGGHVRGGRQLIEINEQGEEFVSNSSATQRWLPLLEWMNANSQQPVGFGLGTAASRDSRLLHKSITELAKQKTEVRVGVDKYASKAIVRQGNTVLRRNVL